MSQRGNTRRPQISTFVGAGTLLLTLALAWLAWPSGGAAAADEAFVVVVNVTNPVAQMKALEVSNLFLKKTTAWKDNQRVLPVDLTAPASMRESFCRKVHNRGPAAVKSYWQQMIFSGREVPPSEKSSAAEVLSFVRANRGAIGYVPSGTSLGPGVKAIEVTP
jgi:hypothetical protein